MRHRIAKLLATCCLAAMAGCSRQPMRSVETVVEELDLPVAELATGIHHRVNFPEPGYRLIQVSQDRADVQLEAVVDGSEKTWDAPAKRAAPERACFYGPAGSLKIELKTKDPVKASAARLRVRITHVKGEPDHYPSHAIQAECIESEAGLEHDRWDETIGVAEAQKYTCAARFWKSIRDEPRAATAYLQAAWMYARRSSNNVDALEQGENARNAFRRAGNPHGQALATLPIAVSRWALADSGVADKDMLETTGRELAAAMETIDKADDESLSAEARGYLASNYFQQGRLHESIQAFAEAGARFRAAGDNEGATRMLINMNIVLNRAGNYRDTAAAFDKLVRDRGNIGGDEVLADILNNSASAHSAAGNYSRAMPQYVEAMKLHQHAGDFSGMARSLNGLASTYMRLGVPTASLVYSTQSLDFLSKRRSYEGPGGDLDELAAYLLAGNAQRALGEFADARISHEAALRFAHNDYTRIQAELELLRDDLASADLDATKRRVDDSDKVLKGATRMQLLQWQLESARAALLQARVDDAIVELRRLEAEFTTVGARDFAIEAIQAQARAEFQRKRFPDALELTTRGFKQLQELRLAVGDPELRTRLTSLHRSAYELRIGILDSLRAATIDSVRSANYLAQIFAAADEMTAGLVHESTDASTLSGDAASARELRDLAAEISFREHLLTSLETGTAPGANEKELRAELSVLRSQYDSLAPPAAGATSGFDPNDYRTDGIRKDAGVLFFLTAKERTRRYWLTDRGVQELGSMALRQPGRSVGSDRQIDRLLPDSGLLAGRKHLIIVADSTLAAVPFAALKPGNEVAPLIARHDLTMALTLRDAIRLAAQPDSNRKANLSVVAVFFNPVFTPFDKRMKVQPAESSAYPFKAQLASSEKEARDIKSMLRNSDVRQYGGFDATRNEAVSERVRQAAVLHFATHASTSDQWPYGSGLLLTAFNEAGVPINGFLSSLDLLSRRSATDLVVLSACDTARGDRSAAENVAGLTRAFLGGGARRVVATRWAVDDAITAKVMSEFYAGLAAGKTPAEALSSAQQKIHSAAPARNDDTWSSFVLYERAP